MKCIMQIVFIPPGWFHCVINLELTVAVTHNFNIIDNNDDLKAVYKAFSADCKEQADTWRALFADGKPLKGANAVSHLRKIPD